MATNLIIFVLILCTSFLFNDASLRTLYMASHLKSEPSDVVINRNDKKFLGTTEKDGHVTSYETTNLRIKRNILNDLVIDKMINVFHMNDSSDLIHVTLSDGGDVVVCLTRSRFLTSPTRVYFSYDSGRTFEEIQSTKMPPLQPGHSTIISKAYSSPVRKSYFIFADALNKCLFVTRDFGRSFQRHSVPFHPNLLKLHSLNENIVLGTDQDDSLHRLWMSDDFGATWSEIQQGVKGFFWGVEDIDKADTLIVQRQEPGGNDSTILQTTDYFHTLPEVLFTGALDFEIYDKYMFATKRQRLLGSHNPDGFVLQLWVSYNRGAFQNALFPATFPLKEFHIADASEDQVFACVVHDDQITTHLYISEVQGVTFSLSLENILYLNPIPSTASSSTDSGASSTPIVDLHKVVGLRGVYIATQVQAGNGYVSLITFDKGGRWDRLSPPTEDMDGKPLPPCNITSNCSLHVTQKLNQLFPFPRRTSNILSKKSAVGIIIASGVLGKSLKGHPNVYLSSDAGLHWHEVLQGNYLYTMGDFGGIIVAVQYFSPEAATDTLLYSTNEGETWESLRFLQDGSKVHVFGLMTIPGEATTIFTIFGSQPSNHSWVWIRVDLRAAFKMTCKKSDYKEWVPRGPHGSCLMGQKEIFERRLAHVPCYNGEDYRRPSSIQPCPCHRYDYECDYGYEEDKASGNCIREAGMLTIPSIPSSCSPGKFYNITKGYRKVSGDKCKAGLSYLYDPELAPCPIKEEREFLMVTLRQKISRLNLNAEETMWESIPMAPPINNVIAFDFDTRNNCIYFADIVDDKVMRQCLDARAAETLLSGPDYDSVEGLALDWVSHNLYIVDGQKVSLSILPVEGPLANRHPRILLNETSLEKPRGIALHPSKGYLFLTDWGANHPAVYRAGLDGSNLTTLFGNTVVTWPNGITVDFADDRIFWVDAKLDYIASAGLDGHDLKYVIRDSRKVPHPFAVAIYKEWIYFDDWVRKEIIMADKYTGLGLHIVASTEGRAMDIKVFSQGTQQASNRCAGNNGCSHLCVGLPAKHHRCLCPGGAVAVQDVGGNETCFCSPGHVMTPDGFCLKSIRGSCNSSEFHCSSSLTKCIPMAWKCDRFFDCDDHRDETYGCESHCENNSFACDNGQCIPGNWRCDFDTDCADESDEKNCSHGSCKPGEFQCKNGRCISLNFLCDLDDDCKDGSDEENCQATTSASHANSTSSACLPGYLPCGPNNNTGQCIPSGWFCDGDHDCLNNWDENNCATASCAPWQFTCHSNSSLRCIFQSWQCDGAADCPDGSDEMNCSALVTTSSPTTAPPLLTTSPSSSCTNNSFWFMCSISKQCIPIHWVCDGVDDCNDHTDELVCGTLIPHDTTMPIPSTPPPGQQECGRNQFQCTSGECIWNSHVCDGQNDCSSGEDERNCHSKPCNSSMFHCLHSFNCITMSALCDGKVDCGDGSDETDCSISINTTEPLTCSKVEFLCHSGDCVPLSSHCDMVEDCQDGSDEANCPGFNFMVRKLDYDIKSVTPHNFSMSWEPPSTQSNLSFHYLPAVRSFGPQQTWINGSWTSALNYTFTNLRPATLYQFQVYTALSNTTKTVFPASRMHVVMTLAAAPCSPTNVTVRQKQNTVVVSWNKPKISEAPITQHKVFISPPIMPFVQKVPGYATQVTIRNFPFEVDTNYTFWVTAVSGVGGMVQESEPSNKTSLLYGASVGLISNLTATIAPNNSIILHWEEDSSNAAELHYVIKYRIDHPKYLPLWQNVSTSTTFFILNNISPGVNYTFKVLAIYSKMSSLSDSVTIETPGKILPLVKHWSLKVKSTSIHITWDLPIDERAAFFTYEIVQSFESKLRKLGQTVNSSEYVLSDLASCQLYDIGVRVRGPHGEEGPLTRFSATYTDLDPQKPIPIEPHISQKNLSTVTLYWKPPCPWLVLGYVIRVRDVFMGKTHWMSLKPTFGNGTYIRLNLTLDYGAHYEAAVGLTPLSLKPTPPALPSPVAKFSGPPLPVPSDLSISQNLNGTLTLYWKEPFISDPNLRYSYKVNVWENVQTTNNLPTHILPALSPGFVIEVKPGVTYHFSVSLVSHKGYVSEPSPIADFVVLPYPEELAVHDSAMNSTATISVGIAAIALMLALAAALVVYVIRHRRLQRAYHNFVNSHYDTRSEAATFHSQPPNAPVITQDLDEDDSPMIRGFSDDEPLVIA